MPINVGRCSYVNPKIKLLCNHDWPLFQGRKKHRGMTDFQMFHISTVIQSNCTNLGFACAVGYQINVFLLCFSTHMPIYSRTGHPAPLSFSTSFSLSDKTHFISSVCQPCRDSHCARVPPPLLSISVLSWHAI